MKLNPYYDTLPENYLFAEVHRRVAARREEDPEAPIISLGIGDVTLPIVPAVIRAMHEAVDDMGRAETFRGYGPENGYAFLREAIVANEYRPYTGRIAPDDIFVSDGSKCDTGNFQELFSADSRIAVCDPVYPVYLDSNLMAGRGDNIVLMKCREENGFVPELPREKVDVIYLCSPNNPTGTAMSFESLARFVDYAAKNDALILFDAAYSAYIRHDECTPHTIYQIPGADEVAVEFKSFSKTAGFTGLRCAFTVVPKKLDRLHRCWTRRQCTKFNGASYVVQKAAAAVYSPEGMEQTRRSIDYYMANADLIRKGLAGAGFTVFGGEDAPYVWLKLPEGVGSWEFFDLLLEKCNVVGTPGVGFGASGEGFFRLTGFGERHATEEAVSRLNAAFSPLS